MSKENTGRKSRKGGLKNLIFILIVLSVIAGIPMILLNYQAKRSGMTWGEVISRLKDKSKGAENTEGTVTDNTTGARIDFLTPSSIGEGFTEPPMISNLQNTDLDGDGLLDIIVCDAKNNTISWIRQFPAGTYTETILSSDLIAPAHVQIVDFDKDGDKDIVVAVLGMLFPNNDKIGSVVILENEGKCTFKKRVVVDKIARVSDASAGDIDNDGDIDLAVGQFGYDDGETRWIENLGDWKFKSHILQNLSGPINTELTDIDKDGDLDIVSLVSQEWEEIYCFINDGKGNFQSKLLWGSTNEDFGSSGIAISDLDKDGDDDIIYTNGDAFDYIPPRPRPWHGVQWLENKGNMTFEYHRICNFAGSFFAQPADIDHDGDLDLFVISGFNFWENEDAQSFIWLENTGNMQFEKHNISNNPTHLITLSLGDFNNDGETDMVTGGMHTYQPFDRMGRITLWMNNGYFKTKK
jgi:hypothetical protein